MPTNAPLNRKLRMGLIGGGQGAFIGRVHATAAILDNRAALVAGALSSDAAKAKASAPDYDIKPERAYGSYQEMVSAEAKLPASERVDFVTVATPNHTHFEIAKAFAEAGFNVMCDKPLTFDLAQAEELAKVVQKTGVVFGVTHNYTGYPLVRQRGDGEGRRSSAKSTPSAPSTSRARLRTRLRRTIRSRPPGAPIRSVPASPAALATSARTPTTWVASSRDSFPRRFPVISRRSSPAGPSMITALP